ncbi:hypothetical protein Q4519_17340 [Motilimonas sp. 1_MG-2023]|uniref:hypothetical protein n=1 Tax=Motilimonas sp. 1_MG-2023 TaxID=3062672 RepID=UPI0026E1D80F|nr:hypothetical protein [Motilimonas sp. 1_MG-2023]MDO6527447.1 hypothetical protein [Motilimonas sp. 1_MG-2023]
MFKKALSYSAIESIGSRVFDFVTLWIVLNVLPVEDVAKFGIATSAIFAFNLIMFAPETALMKHQKQWQQQGVLADYLGAFVSFSVFKISLHYLLAFIVYIISGELNWFFYAVVFSAVTQQIQAAEIARIFNRMELRQKKVAIFENASKILLLTCVLCLYFYPSLDVYFSIYFTWSLLITTIWLANLKHVSGYVFSFSKSMLSKIYTAMMGFSLWSHLSGVMTLYIYNASLLYMGLLGADLNTVAVYTVVNKVANLFFVVPMFFQSFIPVVLANAGLDAELKFKKILAISGSLSIGQFLFFLVLGSYIGTFFGLDPEFSEMFYLLGLTVSFGILALNVSRPLSTYLMIKRSPFIIMKWVFIPATIAATIAFPTGIYFYSSYGAAFSSALIYSLMAVLLYTQYRFTLRM